MASPRQVVWGADAERRPPRSCWRPRSRRLATARSGHAVRHRVPRPAQGRARRRRRVAVASPTPIPSVPVCRRRPGLIDVRQHALRARPGGAACRRLRDYGEEIKLVEAALQQLEHSPRVSWSPVQVRHRAAQPPRPARSREPRGGARRRAARDPGHAGDLAAGPRRVPAPRRDRSSWPLPLVVLPTPVGLANVVGPTLTRAGLRRDRARHRGRSSVASVVAFVVWLLLGGWLAAAARGRRRAPGSRRRGGGRGTGRPGAAAPDARSAASRSRHGCRPDPDRAPAGRPAPCCWPSPGRRSGSSSSLPRADRPVVDAGRSAVVRVIARRPRCLIAGRVTWAIGEIVGAIAARRIVLRRASVGAALAGAIGHVRSTPGRGALARFGVPAHRPLGAWSSADRFAAAAAVGAVGRTCWTTARTRSRSVAGPGSWSAPVDRRLAL